MVAVLCLWNDEVDFLSQQNWEERNSPKHFTCYVGRTQVECVTPNT